MTIANVTLTGFSLTVNSANDRAPGRDFNCQRGDAASFEDERVLYAGGYAATFLS
jgi:hypothetical protein